MLYILAKFGEPTHYFSSMLAVGCNLGLPILKGLLKCYASINCTFMEKRPDSFHLASEIYAFSSRFFLLEGD
jgi:hypothetical protein